MPARAPPLPLRDPRSPVVPAAGGTIGGTGSVGASRARGAARFARAGHRFRPAPRLGKAVDGPGASGSRQRDGTSPAWLRGGSTRGGGRGETPRMRPGGVPRGPRGATQPGRWVGWGRGGRALGGGVACFPPGPGAPTPDNTQGARRPVARRKNRNNTTTRGVSIRRRGAKNRSDKPLSSCGAMPTTSSSVTPTNACVGTPLTRRASNNASHRGCGGRSDD